LGAATVFMANTQENELVSRALKGDRGAFGEIVERYQKMVFNAAYRITRDYDDARDVTQTVFITVFERLNQYRPKYRLSSWLYKIAVNEAIDVLSRRNTQVELNPTMTAPGQLPDEEVSAGEVSKMLEDSIMDLGIETRVLIVLRHFADLSYRELSFVLGVPEKTVKSRLYEARRLLSRILAQRGVFAHE
jgi:RNA polymerase sigma-70 factor (ECF subfamily)